MASTKGKKPAKKRSEEEETLECVEMYKKWVARKPIGEICSEYGGISERTANRRIATGKAIVQVAKTIVPPGYKEHIEEPKPQESSKKVVPGIVSKGIMDRPSPQHGPSNHGAIDFPKRNPLDGIASMEDMGKIGLHIGVIAGGAAHDIQEAFTRTDLPLDQRMLTLSRGSAVVANAVLGVVEMLRNLEEPLAPPMREVRDGQN